MSMRPVGQEGRLPWGVLVSKPAILAVDDDPVVAAAITRERVASAVGEGAMSVYVVHRYLATI
jgi:hypothetical protein